jgi:hypothetical protein
MFRKDCCSFTKFEGIPLCTRRRCRSSSPGRVKNFLFSTSSRLVLGLTQPPLQWVLGALSPGVKEPWREVDYSPPTTAEIKNTWIYISTSPFTFMAYLSTGKIYLTVCTKRCWCLRAVLRNVFGKVGRCNANSDTLDYCLLLPSFAPGHNYLLTYTTTEYQGLAF